MHRNASPIRTATLRFAGRRSPFMPTLRRAARGLWRLAAGPLLALTVFVPTVLALTTPALAQFIHPSDLGMTYTQQRSKFIGDSASDFFYLRGASVDYGVDLYHGVGPVGSLNGLAATNLRQQIDIHQASFLGGGRYTYSLGHVSPTVWNRKGSIFAEGLVGYTVATAGEYPSGNSLVSNASGFTYAVGGGINYNVYHDFELRLMAHYFVTDLPNSLSNQQRNGQLSLGINWHFGN